MKFLFYVAGLVASFITILPVDVSATLARDKLAVDNFKTLGLSTSNATVKRVQKALKDAGYYKDSVNGRFNQNTESAILKYQKHQGLPLNPIASQDLVKHILANKQIQSLLKQLETCLLYTSPSPRD